MKYLYCLGSKTTTIWILFPFSEGQDKWPHLEKQTDDRMWEEGRRSSGVEFHLTASLISSSVKFFAGPLKISSHWLPWSSVSMLLVMIKHVDQFGFTKFDQICSWSRMVVRKTQKQHLGASRVIRHWRFPGREGSDYVENRLQGPVRRLLFKESA